MSDTQPTPKPLTESDVMQCLTGEYEQADAMLRRLWAESAALRAAVAEAEKQRDEALKAFTTGAVERDDLRTSRDALAAELAEARKALRTVHIELAALVADPENPDWRLFHPEIRDPDAKCLTDAYNAARASASKPANDAARELDAGGGGGADA